VAPADYLEAMSERAILEREVASHRARVEELEQALQSLGDDRQAALLRLELKGRAAAVELGAARLRFLRD
jgi:hypothetical protein